jgi:hypothetical protein
MTDIGLLGCCSQVYPVGTLQAHLTFTPAAVRNSCDNVRALSVRFLKLRVLLKLSLRGVVTLGRQESTPSSLDRTSVVHCLLF